MPHTFIKIFVLLASLLLCSQSFAASTKQQAAAEAQQQHAGRVLSVKKKGSVYKVKILSGNGQVRVVKIKATKR